MMCRVADEGAYEASNVYAGTQKDNHNETPAEIRQQAMEKAAETRRNNGLPLGEHLKVRGDGHPRSIAVITPLGRFGSIRLAAEAHGVSEKCVRYRIQHMVGWCLDKHLEVVIS